MMNISRRGVPIYASDSVGALVQMKGCSARICVAIQVVYLLKTVHMYEDFSYSIATVFRGDDVVCSSPAMAWRFLDR